nr:hypothetical protein Iba_chr13eCG8600 [Ipomoea batatas]
MELSPSLLLDGLCQTSRHCWVVAGHHPLAWFHSMPPMLALELLWLVPMRLHPKLGFSSQLNQ